MTMPFSTNYQYRYNYNAHLLSRDELEQIACTLGFSTKQINNKTDLQDRCFSKIVKAYKKGDWDNINILSSLIEKITDHFGRHISDVFKNQETAPPNFAIHPPENLVFQGGGPKGLGYIGALQILEKYRWLKKVERIAGTSAGAITATFLALGYSVDEAQELLMSKDLTDFLDSCFDPNIVIEFLKMAQKKGCERLDALCEHLNCCEHRKIYEHCFNKPGICKGEKFLEWMQTVIQDKTGDPYFTFGDLKERIGQGDRTFKHLHVFATQIQPTIKIVRFSSESESDKWDNLPICCAIRASMSLPAVFYPGKLFFKDPETGFLDKDPEKRQFIDGGVRDEVNFPLWAFDKKKYIHEHELKNEVCQRPETNKKTLGFSLYNSAIEVRRDSGSKDLNAMEVFQLTQEIKNSRNVEMLTGQKKYDQHYRIIKIDDCGVDTCELNLFEKKKGELILSGRKAATIFCSNAADIASIIEDPFYTIPKNKLEITERQAEKLLTLGKRGLRAENDLKFDQGMFGFAVVLTTLGLGAAIITSDLLKQCASRKFEFLALDDKRFRIFGFLADGETKKANAEYTKWKDFLHALTKTQKFRKTFKECVKNYNNIIDCCRGVIKCNNYVNFFILKSLIPERYKRYLQ